MSETNETWTCGGCGREYVLTEMCSNFRCTGQGYQVERIENPAAPDRCPECGSAMIERTGARICISSTCQYIHRYDEPAAREGDSEYRQVLNACRQSSPDSMNVHLSHAQVVALTSDLTALESRLALVEAAARKGAADFRITAEFMAIRMPELKATVDSTFHDVRELEAALDKHAAESTKGAEE